LHVNNARNKRDIKAPPSLHRIGGFFFVKRVAHSEMCCIFVSEIQWSLNK